MKKLISLFMLGSGVASLFLLANSTARGQTNSWIASTSGDWTNPSWSLGVLPNQNQSVMITNAGFKAVAISPSDPGNFPASMTVSNLTVDAPTNSLNTLLLNFSGTSIPLKVLNSLFIGPNGKLDNEYGSVIVQGVSTNPVCIINGAVIQQGGFWSVPNASVLMSAGSVSLNGNCLFHQFNLANGTFTQGSGTNNCLALLLAPPSNSTNASTVLYQLNGGLLLTTNTEVGQSTAPATFVQTGGTHTSSSLTVGVFGLRNALSNNYQLSNGVVTTASLAVGDGGNLTQTGGSNTIQGDVSIGGQFSGAFYGLNGGWLTASNLTITSGAGQLGGGQLTQNGGTNIILNNLEISGVGSSFGGATYSLSGGLLVSSNLTILGGGQVGGGDLFQTGGTNIVLKKLELKSSSSGSGFAGYTLQAGMLNAPDIELGVNGTLSHSGGILVNQGTFTFNGGTFQSGLNEQLGQLILASNTSDDLGVHGSIQHFLDSHTESWGPLVILHILNWNGSTNGGGTSQFIVGNSGAGLTGNQLAQIRFDNPAGFAAGIYYARILNTGEVVPTSRPLLAVTRQGSNLILTWPQSPDTFILQSATNAAGPYADVPSATSPYTNTIGTISNHFFRLR